MLILVTLVICWSVFQVSLLAITFNAIVICGTTCVISNAVENFNKVIQVCIFTVPWVILKLTK